MNRKRIISLAFILWSIFIVVMLLLPNDYLASESKRFITIPHFDKIVHCGLFGGFCFLLYFFTKLRVEWKEKFLNLFCLILTLGYGFLGEVLQLITYKWFARTFTLADLIADLVGGILALVFITLAKKKMNL
ncbi:MAG: VanZ family protein [Bacteroidales bacterium]|nr:VanZ family protein [Bacteroidales bacterium]